MKTVFYQVERCVGEYDDISWSTIFITDKEYKAKFYVSRASEIFKKYSSFYDEKQQNTDAENWMHWFERLQMCQCTFYSSEIEFRKNVKINTPTK